MTLKVTTVFPTNHSKVNNFRLENVSCVQLQEGDDARDQRIQKQNRAVNARNRREDLENVDLENWVNGNTRMQSGQELADQSWES